MNKELLEEFFQYADGHLYWKKCTTQRVKVGSIAGTKRKDGYYRLQINKKQYLNHRIIFFMHHGYLPEYIDHINRNTSDNRIENLRPATLEQNQHNSKLPKNNTSGVKGVDWKEREGKWQVRLTVNGKTKAFGYYYDIDYAKFVSDAMRYKYHGKFYNNGRNKT